MPTYGRSEASTGGYRGESSCTEREESQDRLLDPILAGPSISETLLLSPWEKFAKYNKFPFKFTIHLLLLFLVTLQVIVFNLQDAVYSRTMHTGFKYYFMPSDNDTIGNPNPEEFTFLYSINETLAAIQGVSDGFWQMSRSSIAVVGYVEAESFSTCHIPSIITTNTSDPNYFVPKNPSLTIRRAHGEPDEMTYSYDSIPQGPIGEIVPEFNSTESLSHLIDNLDDFQFEMRLCNENLGKLYRACYEWNVVVTFSFSNYANIYVTVHDDIVGKCDDVDLNEYMSKILHNAGIVSVGVIYLCLILKDFARRVKVFLYVRRAHGAAQKVLYDSYLEESDSDIDDAVDAHFVGEGGENVRDVVEIPWNKMPYAVFFKFFPFWNLLSFAGSLISVAYSLYTAFDKSYHIPTTILEKFGSGFGCMLLWLSLTQFYRHNKQYYSFILTMQHAIPLLLPFLVGVIPVFVGYAMFGVSYFGSQSALFALPSDAFVTLFSLLNGDVIYQTFTSIWQPNQIIVNVYLYTFISVFIYLVLNVTISVVEHSFFTSQGTPRTFDVFIRRGFAMQEEDKPNDWYQSQQEANKDGGRDGWKQVALKPNFFRPRPEIPPTDNRQTILESRSLGSRRHEKDGDRIKSRQLRRRLKREDRKSNTEGNNSRSASPTTKSPRRRSIPSPRRRSIPSPSRNNDVANDRSNKTELTLHEQNVLLSFLEDEVDVALDPLI
ncbi:hypothetical protein TrRE_jg2546 [Triparma retinervis]|uniref:Polycystin cation channel PKD1/PKD2 domain-containing protein n=1 Tax=Triparma retinervis TaxID=2557542 RepID=A0A9W6ZVZ9_9STRA|nr:hypothetical protein TrRE_jg2546 [Triparma retinervis]